jgi:hypothetical protein
VSFCNVQLPLHVYIDWLVLKIHKKSINENKIRTESLVRRHLDWVAQTLSKFKRQLKLNWHLNLHEMYIELIYTYGLIET